MERGGEVITRVVQGRAERWIIPEIKENVARGTFIATDDANAFQNLGVKGGYTHEVVNHSAKEYVRGRVHTNTIEAFWSMVKRTIEGTHIWVSKKYLPTYLREIEYRWNLRDQPSLMFELLIQAFPGRRWLRQHRVKQLIEAVLRLVFFHRASRLVEGQAHWRLH